MPSREFRIQPCQEPEIKVDLSEEMVLGKQCQEALTAFFFPIQAVERVLYPHLSTYWTNLQAVLDDYSVSNAQVKADGHKVYGAILVSARPCHPLLPASAQLAYFTRPRFLVS